MAWMTFLLFIVHASAKCTKSGEGPDGKGGCSACPVGTSTEGSSGRAEKDRCGACEAGKYADTAGSNACKTCEPGKYAAVKGLKSCTVCPVDFYSNRKGEKECYYCPSVGKDGTGGKTGARQCEGDKSKEYLCIHRNWATGACLDCEAGQSKQDWASKKDGSKCFTCEKGKYAGPNPGAKACNYCPRGKFMPTDGVNVACKDCPVNTWSDVSSGATECAKCSSTRSTKGKTGQRSCQYDDSLNTNNAGNAVELMVMTIILSSATIY